MRHRLGRGQLAGERSATENGRERKYKLIRANCARFEGGGGGRGTGGLKRIESKTAVFAFAPIKTMNCYSKTWVGGCAVGSCNTGSSYNKHTKGKSGYPCKLRCNGAGVRG